MSQYAAKTEVSSSKSRDEIERILLRYGADQFMYGWQECAAVIRFRMAGKQVAFMLPLPSKDDKQFTEYLSHGDIRLRAPEAAEKLYEQACRQKWRALALVVKAKLEAVESNISTFEDEFMANIVLPDGRLIGQFMRPQIEHAYATGNMPPMLPAYSKDTDHAD